MEHYQALWTLACSSMCIQLPKVPKVPYGSMNDMECKGTEHYQELWKLACSLKGFHAVPWACMQFHELAFSFMSLHAVTRPCMQFHKLAACMKCHKFACSFICLHAFHMLASSFICLQVVSWVCMQFLKDQYFSEQLTRISQCLFSLKSLKLKENVYLQKL